MFLHCCIRSKPLQTTAKGAAKFQILNMLSFKAFIIHPDHHVSVIPKASLHLVYMVEKEKKEKKKKLGNKWNSQKEKDFLQSM